MAAQTPLHWYAGPMPVAFVNHWLKSAMLLGLEDGEGTTRDRGLGVRSSADARGPTIQGSARGVWAWVCVITRGGEEGI